MYKRRVFGIVATVLFSAALAAAQDGPGSGLVLAHDDHNDKSPVQSGFAVITPATTSGTASLVVFETFGLRGGADGTSQSGVLPSGLTTNSLLFADHSGRLSKNLGVAIVNPNDTSANVGVTLRKSDGTQVATTTLNVPSHQQMSKFITELFPSPPSIPSDVTGSLAITSSGTSNLPVSVIGLRFRGRNFSTIPATNLAPASPTGSFGLVGPGAVILPQF